VKVNLEGDVQVSDDTIEGLGITQQFLRNFFGSLFLVAKAPSLPPRSDFSAPFEMSEISAPPVLPHPAVSQTLPPRSDAQPLDALLQEAQEGLWQSFKSVLIACVPNPGYFVAGGVAGIVSRTSTAPLDRLKVYLIAQTEVAQDAIAAAKSGNIFRAAANSWRPLAKATQELWQAGGMRSLYAGKSKRPLR
jgi:solute carrier family 25 phosphate transporter 23/24/25/41